MTWKPQTGARKTQTLPYIQWYMGGEGKRAAATRTLFSGEVVFSGDRRVLFKSQE